MRWSLIICTLAIGCLYEETPGWGGPADAVTGGSASTTATDSAGTGADGGTATTGGAVTTDASGATSDGSVSGTTASVDVTTGDFGGLGLACGGDASCDQAAGEVCCADKKCADTCMVPCMEVAQCPFQDMGCEHGWCFFECTQDADCEPWPGYVCHHMMRYCEKP